MADVNAARCCNGARYFITRRPCARNGGRRHAAQNGTRGAQHGARELLCARAVAYAPGLLFPARLALPPFLRCARSNTRGGMAGALKHPHSVISAVLRRQALYVAHCCSVHGAGNDHHYRRASEISVRDVGGQPVGLGGRWKKSWCRHSILPVSMEEEENFYYLPCCVLLEKARGDMQNTFCVPSYHGYLLVTSHSLAGGGQGTTTHLHSNA